MTLHLYFDLAQTLQIADHAVAVAEHKKTFTEREDGTACPGALVWVHDQGVYLMSSGIPGLMNPHRPDRHLAVYASGWNPDTDGYRHDWEIGDDFAEHLHLTTQDRLIDELRTAHASGHQWLHLTVYPDTYEVRTSRTRLHQS
ncbi:DUF3085 domain-containing protein [Micromonospora craterilacus]|nr:DUF3085 domain-containing protein [Micromonospora craterilacus]